MNDRNETRVGTEQIQSLLERCHAKHGPITSEQLHRFERHPMGPILPDACVEVRKLPEEYGTHRTGEKRDPAVVGLSVTPAGDPVLMTVIKGVVGIARRDTFFQMATESWRESAVYCPSEVFFLDPMADEPLVAIQFHHDDGFPEDSTSIGVFRGSKPQFTETYIHSEPQMLRSGALIFRTDNAQTGLITVRNGEPIPGIIERNYCQFFEQTDGKILATWWTEVPGPSLRGRPTVRGTAFAAGYIDQEQPLIEHPDRIFLATTTNGTYLVLESPRGKQLLCQVSENPPSVSPLHSMGSHPYISDLTELEDGRRAHIGKAYRDGLLCWVITRVRSSSSSDEEPREVDIPQPGFRCISPLFQRGTDYCYYGIVGRHLYTMQLPHPEV